MPKQILKLFLEQYLNNIMHANHMGPNMSCKITKIIETNERVGTSLAYL